MAVLVYFGGLIIINYSCAVLLNTYHRPTKLCSLITARVDLPRSISVRIVLGLRETQQVRSLLLQHRPARARKSTIM